MPTYRAVRIEIRPLVFDLIERVLSRILTNITLACCKTDLCDPANRHSMLRIKDVKAKILDIVFSVNIILPGAQAAERRAV